MNQNCKIDSFVCVYLYTHNESCESSAVRLKKPKWCQNPVEVPGVHFKDYEKETAFQIYCADWLRKQYQLTRDQRFAFWHHSANERHDARGGFLAKMMGQSKGFPDFIHCGLSCALELKIEGGKLSAHQVAWLEHFKSIGWTVEVVYNFEQFRDVVLGLRGSSRAP